MADKTLDTLVRDIYKLMENQSVPLNVDMEEVCASFGQECEKILFSVLTEKHGNGLRLSAIGKPDRQIYNRYHGIKGEDIKGATKIKFLYGHLIEAMVVALARLSGHKVTDQQKECTVEGVKGHTDGRIDGVLVDIKSASDFGFKKFKKGTLHEDDPFGYIAQLKGYAKSEGDTEYAWVAMNKTSGELCVLKYDETDTEAPYHDAVNWDVADRVRYLKEMVGSDLVPTKCFPEVPDGKSGNMKLSGGCVWCEFKHVCWPELRTFRYSNGVKYVTKVVREPRVMEVPDGF
jgi:hypothetical protein